MVKEELWCNGACPSTVEKNPAKQVTTPMLKSICD